MVIDSDILLKELEKLHPAERGWLFFHELRMGTGYNHYVEKRIDAWAINAWPSVCAIQHTKTRKKRIRAPYLRRAFEIKINQSDVLKELRDPDKRWMAYAISHEFYFVAPKGLIDPQLLSNGDGLMEWDGSELKTIKQPRVREGMPPRWSFVAAIARRVHENGRYYDQKGIP